MTINQSYDEFFSDANLAIEGALASPRILEALAPYGYPQDRIREGQRLYTAALNAQQ
ncbi:hypothetical protein [Synechococcus sp. PCC 7336]|uniref:hypothetical protein n=1 Tax=Synechococcus sp. PCC 7336 TaxID=195250 RepID=UPI00034AF4CF|nr:hypothetical protein [Synechococcus sp. PCC 7336]